MAALAEHIRFAVDDASAPFDSSAQQVADALDSLRRLNREFLRLTIGLSVRDDVETLDLSTHTARALRQLAECAAADVALENIARTPYALFVLPDPMAADCGATVANDAQRRFASAALFYAWHVAHLMPAHSQLWFGVGADSVMRLRTLHPADVGALAFDRAGAIAARNAAHPQFWPDLIRHACDGDSERLQLTQLLGRQLIET